jgi:hypothetical protein
MSKLMVTYSNSTKLINISNEDTLGALKKTIIRVF